MKAYSTLFIFFIGFSYLIYSQPEWTVMPSGINTDLNAVWGTGPGNVYAVGSAGIILHFDGTSWTQMNSPTTGTLVSIIGFSDNEIYALGFNLYKYDGSDWSIVNGAPGGNVIWGTSGSNLYVGNGNGIKHFDGTQWKDEVTFFGFGNVAAIHGISPTEIYAGNDAGGLFHYKHCNQQDGSFSWERTEVLTGQQQIAGVWGMQLNSAFAATDQQIYRFTGELTNNDCFNETWSLDSIVLGASKHLEGLFGLSNQRIYMFGFNDIVNIAGSASLIYEYNGQSWRLMTTQTDSVSMKSVYAMWGSDTSEIFAVGQKGLILRKGGKVLNELIVNTADDKPDLNPGDGICDCGGAQIKGKPPCSLRAAIMEANANQSTENILFDIQGATPHKIILTSGLPVITDETKIVGTLTNNLPDIIIDGENAGNDVNGLSINFGTSANGRKCEIKNLILINFGGCGIFLNQSYENIIQGCYIGIDPEGNSGLGNLKDGINILNSFSNQIGGDALQKRNIISGNLGNGLTITGNKSTLNIIENNFIGTKPDGMADEANESSGVLIEQDAFNNLLKKNLIAGNHKDGVRIQGEINIKTQDNKLVGNKIGTNVDGTTAVKNSFYGVYIENAITNIIGGSNQDDRNIISGNGRSGILLKGESCRGTSIMGNYIGASSNGMDALGNEWNGIEIARGKENVIGGAVSQPGSGPGNVISGNMKSGIYISDQSAGNSVAGNLIGTKANGMEKLGNLNFGVIIENSPNNTIGGDAPIFRNIISGNEELPEINGIKYSGVFINGSSSVNNKIQCNYIGLDINGLNAVKNFSGIIIQNGPANIIGGDISSSGNLISGNTDAGISILSSFNNKIKGNIIGLDKNGKEIKNASQNIGIDLNSSSNNEIGGLTPNEKNVISDHELSGINIEGGEGNKIKGNFIGVDIEGKNIRRNYNGISIFESSRNIIGGDEKNSTNIISGNEKGIYISGGLRSVANEIDENLIGTNFNEDSLGNSTGIEIVDAADTYIGIGFPYLGRSFAFADSIVYLHDFPPNNKIFYNQTGIFLQQIIDQPFRNVHIKQNAFAGNITGLRTIESNNVEVLYNLFWENKSGVICNSSRIFLENNYFFFESGRGSSVHLDNSYARVKNNLITADAGDAVRLENNSTADINYNNIYNNAGFGVNNTNPSVLVNAQNNWWGDASGPGGQGSGTGNPVSMGVNFLNWLPQLLSVTVTASVDTLFAPPDHSDSVDVYIGNFINPNDKLDLTINDDKNWIQGSSNYSVSLDSTFGISTKIHLKVPGSILPGTINKVIIKAVSQSESAHNQSDTLYVQVYQPGVNNVLVYPDTAKISPGDSIQFYTYGYDQFNKELNFTPHWSSTGGIINNKGWLFAGMQPGSYEITATDPDSKVQGHALVIISSTVGIKDKLAEIPTEYNLYQNYPNPFNPSTKISYAIPVESEVTIKIYNILGEQVDQLVNEIKYPGIHAMNWNASSFASGIYVYTIQARAVTDNKKFFKAGKMVLLK